MTSDPSRAHKTRVRILDAAKAIAKESAASRLSVRAVAARAGVGMGTLRYHFATQRELLDAVLSSLYEEALPDERIRDPSVPAEERLLACCRHMLDPVGIGDRAREVWADIFETFIAPDASRDHRTGYVEMRRQAALRVEGWISILAEEGAIPRGDNKARTDFLLAILDGLALQRALPSEASLLEVETSVLRAAIGALVSSG